MGIENPVHLLFLAAVALVVLGPKRLPELARALGKGMREFREAMSGESRSESATPDGSRRRSAIARGPVRAARCGAGRCQAGTRRARWRGCGPPRPLGSPDAPDRRPLRGLLRRPR